MESKVWYLSKSVWFGLLTGLAAALMPVVPALNAFVQAYLPVIGAVWGILAVVLRAASSGKITLQD